MVKKPGIKMIYRDIKKRLKKENLHFTLLDPAEQSPEKSAEIAKRCADFGTDCIMVGGSDNITVKKSHQTIKEIKKFIDLPVIIFPSSSKSISKEADAIFFMSLLNSQKREYLISKQVEGAPLIKKFNIEPISMGYIVLNTGTKTTVERKGKIIKLGSKDVVNYALTAEYMGMKMVYLEAGSGADKPIPKDKISLVKKNIGVPLVIGGGIRNGKSAYEAAVSGGDIIVTGTIVEKSPEKLKDIIASIKKASTP